MRAHTEIGAIERAMLVCAAKSISYKWNWVCKARTKRTRCTRCTCIAIRSSSNTATTITTTTTRKGPLKPAKTESKNKTFSLMDLWFNKVLMIRIRLIYLFPTPPPSSLLSLSSYRVVCFFPYLFSSSSSFAW